MSRAPIPAIQAALVERMLIEKGLSNASEPLVHNGIMYRITVEQVTPGNVAAETRRAIDELSPD